MQFNLSKVKIIDTEFVAEQEDIPVPQLTISTRNETNTAEAENFIRAAVDNALSGNNGMLNDAEKLAAIIRDAFITEGTAACFTPLFCGLEYELIRLHFVTGNDIHLDTARSLILKRGTVAEETLDGKNREYHLSHLPVLKIAAPIGEANSTIKMYAALAALYKADRDGAYYEAATRFYTEVEQKKCDIRFFPPNEFGGKIIGSSDYDIMKNYSAQAAQSLARLALELSQIENKTDYHNVIERIIFNGAVKDVRPYIFAEREGVVYLNQYISADYISSGGLVSLRVTNYKNGGRLSDYMVTVSAPSGVKVKGRVTGFNNGLYSIPQERDSEGYFDITSEVPFGFRIMPRYMYASDGERANTTAVMFASRLLAAPQELNPRLPLLQPARNLAYADKPINQTTFAVPALMSTFARQKFTYVLPRKKVSSLVMSYYESLDEDAKKTSKIFFNT